MVGGVGQQLKVKIVKRQQEAMGKVVFEQVVLKLVGYKKKQEEVKKRKSRSQKDGAKEGSFVRVCE